MKNFVTSILMTIVTTILLGLIYPLAVTGLAQVIFPDKANGQTHQARGWNNRRLAHHRAAVFFAGQFSLASFGGGRVRLRCGRVFRLESRPDESKVD
jgi:hypothetical protein